MTVSSQRKKQRVSNPTGDQTIMGGETQIGLEGCAGFAPASPPNKLRSVGQQTVHLQAQCCLCTHPRPVTPVGMCGVLGMFLGNAKESCACVLAPAVQASFECGSRC